MLDILYLFALYMQFVLFCIFKIPINKHPHSNISLINTRSDYIEPYTFFMHLLHFLKTYFSIYA